MAYSLPHLFRSRGSRLGSPTASARHLGWIPAGDAGTRATLQVMASLVNAAQVDPEVFRAAQRIAGSVAGGGAQIGALRTFLQDAVRFVRDPVDVETVKAPDLLLQEVAQEGAAYGDCDDIAVLGAALGKAAGFPARFVAVGFDPAGPYEHVYTDLLDPERGTWYELDVSRELQGIDPGASFPRLSYFPV